MTWVRSLPKLKPLERIAILLDSGVGDTLMATPMLRELRRQLPHAAVIALVNRGTAQVLAHNFDVDRLCIFRASGDTIEIDWQALQMARAFRPQAIIAPQTSNVLIQIFAAFYPGAPVRVKHRFDYPADRRYSDFEFLFTHSPPTKGDRHRVWDNLALLGELGLKTETETPALVFPLSSWDILCARQKLERKGWTAASPAICIHPGVGTATLNKQWPANRFAEVGKRLAAKHGLQVVLVGGKGESDLCQRVADHIGPGCFVVAGECSLAETGAVIQSCRFFLSNDSGLMHLAAALGARGLALFGTTNPAKIGPFGGNIHVLQASRIDAITTDEVLRRCDELLQPTDRSN